MLRDRITLGMVAGTTGNMVKNALDVLLPLGKPTEVRFSDIAAGIYIPKGEAATRTGRLLGRLVDYGLATIYGIPTVYLLSYTGRDKHLLKGAMVGVLTWSIGLGLARTLGVSNIYPLTAKDNLRMLLVHMVGGMATTQTALMLGDPELFGDHEIEQTRRGVRRTVVRAKTKPPAFARYRINQCQVH